MRLEPLCSRAGTRALGSEPQRFRGDKKVLGRSRRRMVDGSLYAHTENVLLAAVVSSSSSTSTAALASCPGNS